MSIAIISRVLNSPEPKGAARLVLLVYADRCDDDGGRCFPSIADTARRAAMSRTQAQTHTQALINGGFLEVVANANGGPPGATRHYRVCLERLAPASDATGPEIHTPKGPGIRREGHGKPAQTGPEIRHDGPGNPHPNHHEPPLSVTERIGGGSGGASGPSGDGLTPTPQAEAPGGMDADLWAAIAARPAFRKSPAALEALAGEVSKAQAAGECPEVLTRRLRVLLEPERQHLTRLPFDPAAPRAAKTATPRRAPRKSTERIDYGRDTRRPGLDYTKW